MEEFEPLFNFLMEGNVGPLIEQEPATGMKQDRLPREEALKRFDLVKATLVELGIDADAIEPGGSIRRGKDTVGDLDVGIFDYDKISKGFYSRFVETMKAKGHEVTPKTLGASQTSLLIDGFLVELKKFPTESYGAAMIFITGPGQYNLDMRGWAKGKGYKLNRYGLFDAASGKMYPSDKEEGIYKQLGIPYEQPSARLKFSPPREERPADPKPDETQIPEELWNKVPDDVKAKLKDFDVPAVDENGIRLGKDFLWNKKVRQRYHITYSQAKRSGQEMKPKFELPAEFKLDRY